ncbi:MAG: hypothetical protein K8L97_15815 [Anaerolineae bacterium]|nr:hypothetical protein [Anaerolineae bacterium]
MQICFDVVDLLQLGEIWCKRPIVTAFTRLEPRVSLLPTSVSFQIDELMPRLSRLKRSPSWRLRGAKLNNDPARMPMSDLSEADLTEMYPEAVSPAVQRQILFNAAYNRFVFASYRGDVGTTCAMLQALARVRSIEEDECLDGDALPRHGSPEWIPADITDEIRSMDARYNAAEPGTPATYVISDQFWQLLVKATPEDVDGAVRFQSNAQNMPDVETLRQALNTLATVAYNWNRSPSVVGLCYQIAKVESQ